MFERRLAPSIIIYWQLITTGCFKLPLEYIGHFKLFLLFSCSRKQGCTLHTTIITNTIIASCEKYVNIETVTKFSATYLFEPNILGLSETAAQQP